MNGSDASKMMIGVIVILATGSVLAAIIRELPAIVLPLGGFVEQIALLIRDLALVTAIVYALKKVEI